MGIHSLYFKGNRGFSLVEVLVTVGLIGVVVGMAIVTFTNVLPTMRADSGMKLVLSQLREARQAAVDQRRNFLVTFVDTRRITVARQELNGDTTVVADYTYPYDMTTAVYSEVPDTPDGFGKTQAVNFNGNILAFLSDGTAVDSTGMLVNGTVFLGIGSNRMTARAITVMGGTGRIRSYRYDGIVFK